MPRIQPYEQQIAPQGFDTSQARASDFDTGTGLAALGSGLASAGQAMYQVEEQQESAKAHATVSDLRMKLTKQVIDAEKDAQPGDTGYADRIQQSIQQQLDQAGQQFQTLRGRDTFLRAGEALQASFVDRSLAYQQNLQARQAVVNFNTTQDANARTLGMDPSQLSAINAENERAILNGEGHYGALDHVKRQELVNGLKQSNAWAAAYSAGEQNPEGALNAAMPGWTQRRINGVPIGGTASGGASGGSFGEPFYVSKAVRGMLPVIQQAAAAKGVDPNVLAAQAQQESGGVTGAVSSKGAKGFSQFMPETAARYNVDVNNDVSSINGQAAYMADLLKMFGGDYQKALAGYNWGEGNVQKALAKYGNDWLAHAPAETRTYVGNILKNVSVSEPASVAAQKDPSLMASASNIPGWKDLPFDKQITLINHWETRQNQIMAVQKAQLEKTWNDQASQAMTTGQVGVPLAEAQFQRAYGAAEGTRRYNEEYKPMLELGASVQQAYGATNSQQDATLQSLRPIPNTPGFAEAQKRYDTYANAVNMVRQQRNNDPIQFAIQARLQGVQPLDMTTPDNMADGVAARVAPAKAMSTSFGTKLAVLTKAEAEGMNTALKQMPTTQKLAYLDALRAKVNDPDAFRAVVQQITPDSPVTLAAASLLAKQDDMTVRGHWFKADEKVTPKEVAGIVLEGEALLNKSKGDKQTDGASRGFPMPQELMMRQAFEDKVGNAFAGMPGAADTAYQAVRAYYAGKSARTGNLSSKENPDTKLIDESVKAVLGNTYEQNGAKVLMPWGATEDKFVPALQQAFTATMAANGYAGSRLDNLRLYGLQGAGDGKYFLKSGTDFLRGPSGDPVVVDVYGGFAPLASNTLVPQARGDVKINQHTRAGRIGH